MGQTLTNGIFLPNEGERNCYTGLAGNWRAIDGYIGDYNVHVADAVIHVSQADRNKWDAVDNKADASALTAHTGDTTIHVTAEDKSKWNGKADASALTAHTGDTTIHVTAADKQTWDAVTGKANDADVMHLTGNEIVGGQKTLVNLLPLKGEFLGTEASNNGRSLLYFLANRDTQNQSGIFLTKFRQNKAQGAMSGNDIVYLSFDCLENSVRTNNGLRINFLNFVGDIPQRFILWSGITERLLGAASAPWSDVSTNQINGLNPSSLGMPDLDNGIDISGYITVVANANKESLYTPPANGWISVALTRAGGSSVAVMLKQGNIASSGHRIDQENGTATCNAMLPVKGGVQVSINSALADGIDFAYFYPCQGNI